jgi:hypothetical protein
MRSVASAALVALALSAAGCSENPKSDAGTAVSGAGTGVSTAGVSGGVAGVGASAGAGGLSAGAGGTTAGSDGGTAGGAPPVCKLEDNPTLMMGDAADGGIAPDCQNIPQTIIANNCIGGICHHTPNKFQGPAGSLDLMSPCVADRLVNVPSTTCNGIPLIDLGHVENSFLLNKLEAETPICGEPMPFTGHLPIDQQRCMHAWVNAIVRSAK